MSKKKYDISIEYSDSERELAVTPTSSCARTYLLARGVIRSTFFGFFLSLKLNLVLVKKFNLIPSPKGQKSKSPNCKMQNEKYKIA